MKKVFMIHGFQGSPNGGWRSWLMSELNKNDIYACSLAMPKPDEPICEEWVSEIAHNVERGSDDEIYLVGHSLGVPAILHYLEKSPANVKVSGAVLVSGPSEPNDNPKITNFLDKGFDFLTIKSKVKNFVIIHGDNDPNVPLNNAETISRELGGELIVVPNGGHLNGSSGWNELPPALEALNKMIS